MKKVSEFLVYVRKWHYLCSRFRECLSIDRFGSTTGYDKWQIFLVIK